MKKSLITLALAAALSAPAFAAEQYLVRVPANVNLSAAAPETPSEPLSVVLSPEALPAATVNEPYSFNLADRLSITGGTGSYNLGDVAWSLKTGDALPPGLALENGTIAGTPTTKNETGTSFEVTGSYQDASGQQVYTIVVDGAVMKALKISTGFNFSCAVTLEGAAKCWGSNTYGSIGDGTTTSSMTPVQVAGLESGVQDIDTGEYHACALTASGGVKCWGGSNIYGEIGDGGAIQLRLTPRTVYGLETGVKAISLGGNHSCALMDSGQIRCWGRDSQGQLGNDAEMVDKPIPVAVSGISGARAISSGGSFSCAITNTGSMKCWGSNSHGQLGNGSTTKSALPVNVAGLTSGVTDISSGGAHACAIHSGTVKCWGYNYFGQLGDSTKVSRAYPDLVAGLSAGVSRVYAGTSHSCAVLTGGKLMCWGNDQNYQLGDDMNRTNPAVPVDVMTLNADVTFVSAGENSTCAIKSNHETLCWGSNLNGVLGNGTTDTSHYPTDVLP